MKTLFQSLILLLILNSCDIYSSFVSVSINGTDSGKLVVSSNGFYRELYLTDKEIVKFDCDKGRKYYFSFYPYIGSSLSRYPLGAVVDSSRRFVTLSPHLGVVTSICSRINYSGSIPVESNVNRIIKELYESEDPWLYDENDIEAYLTGKITIGSISTYKVFDIPELDFLRNWISENRLFSKWYKSVQFFQNRTNKDIYRVEIYEDGSFYGFLEVN